MGSQRLCTTALPAAPIVFGPSIDPKSPLDVGDENAADLDNGIQVALVRTVGHYRVSVLDLRGRPVQDGQNTDDEEEARRWARDLVRTYYPGGAIRSVVTRSGRTACSTRIPQVVIAQPEGVQP